MTDAEAIALSLRQPTAFEHFTRAFAARRTYDRTRSDARPWLFGIATNVLSHHWRQDVRAGAAPATDHAPVDDAAVSDGRLDVRISDDAVDRLGRHGTAVRLDATAVLDPSRPPYRRFTSRRITTIVLDPGKGALLGTRSALVGPDGRVDGDYGAVFSSAVVQSITARP